MQAEAANRQKSQFLSNMSHEIRTPLNAILGTGLGLPFCKLAVEAHGGTIGVASEVGRGSVCLFIRPDRPGNPPVTVDGD